VKRDAEQAGRLDLRALPKANLHLHLTGSMRPSTLIDLADRYGLPLPPPLPPRGKHPWEVFQTRYDTAREAIRTADDLRRVVREAIQDNLEDGCVWLEMQVDPTSYAPLLGGFEPVVEAALDAMRGQPAGLVLASSWARSGEHARQIAELSNRYDTVGFGLSNDERRGTVDDFVAAARTTSRMVVPHGGFYEGAWHVRECVGKLNAKRIGHGLKAMHDKETVDILVENDVALEVCPTSYPPLGVAEHDELPLRSLLEQGVKVTLANDDPLLFGASVTDQYVIARDIIGLTDEELTTIAQYSIKASSMP